MRINGYFAWFVWILSPEKSRNRKNTWCVKHERQMVVVLLMQARREDHQGCIRSAREPAEGVRALHAAVLPFSCSLYKVKWKIGLSPSAIPRGVVQAEPGGDA